MTSQFTVMSNFTFIQIFNIFLSYRNKNHQSKLSNKYDFEMLYDQKFGARKKWN